MRGERYEHVRWTGRHVEAVPAVVTVCGPDSMGCQRTGCDVMLGTMGGDTQFCDVFLTWDQARKLVDDLAKLIERHDKGET
jgi:hypothetical protein